MSKSDTTNGSTPDGNTPASLPGIFDVLDLTSPLREIYQMALKEGEVSVEEMMTEFPLMSADEMHMYLNLLCRLDYLEKYLEQGQIRFKPRGHIRGKKKLSDDLWKKLGS